MSTGRAVIAGMASVVPPGRDQAELWSGFVGPRVGGGHWAERIYRSAGVGARHLAVDPTKEDISGWSTGQRMARYLPEALPLGKAALADALAAAGLDPGDVGLFAVASCTGYATPGIDIHLARDLAMAEDVQRLLIGHMGCYAALPGLGAVSDFVVARGRPAVLLCVELCSLHVQAPTLDPQQLVVHALFADAAAAVAVVPGLAADGTPRQGPGLAVVDVAAATDAASAGHMSWDITDHGFRMGLSRRVPGVVAARVGPLVGGLLARNGIRQTEVARWAVHPGGPRILDVAEERLGLRPEQLAASRRVLSDNGNCSSATILLVIEEIQRSHPLPRGGYLVAIAFGPGLTLYAALLRAG